jgi:hypothetical protein
MWGPGAALYHRMVTRNRTGLFGRSVRQPSANARRPQLSFGSWEQFPKQEPRVVQICHPDWRGVRTVAYAFRSPVIECDDLEQWSKTIIDGLETVEVSVVIIQGWPPGSGFLATELARRAIEVKCVLHSSPAQHGAEAGEAVVVGEVLGLLRAGILKEVGMAKAGVPVALQAAGYQVTHVPNRVPLMPQLEKVDLGPGLHVGVFAEPFWRKNLATQLLAVGLLDGATAHVMTRPDVPYLGHLNVVEHGEMEWARFLALQGSVDLNLYVTLSECHPSTPQESYLAGVPCLISRVSGVFADEPGLWELTSVDRLDDPSAIAIAARRLMLERDNAVALAMSWMERHDGEASRIWHRFTSPSSN